MENAHDQRTLKHTLLYHESHWVHPVTSVSTTGLLKQAQSLWGPTVLPPSQTGLFISYHLLSCSSLKRSFSFPPSACLHPFPPQPLPSHRPPLFFTPSFHLFLPSTSPLSSFALSSSASVLGASRIFPWFRFSFPSSIALLSPLPRWSLRPLARFLPSSFHHSVPFLSLAFSTLRFHSVLPWGFQGGLKRS